MSKTKESKVVGLPKKAIELIEQRNFGHIATINKDGSLHVTPVWIDHEGGKYILVNSAYGRRKVRNLERDKRVAVEVLDSKDPYHYVTISGRVAQITSENADPHIDKMAKKYTGKDKYSGRSPQERRALIKIEPSWVKLN